MSSSRIENLVSESHASFSLKSIYPRPTEAVFEATSGRSPLYSREFTSLCAEYHYQGRSWPQEKLELFFREGLLQFYVGIVAGYDFRYQNLNKDEGMARWDMMHSYRQGGESQSSLQADERYHSASGILGIWASDKFIETCGGSSAFSDEGASQPAAWLPVIAKLFDQLKQTPFLLKLGAEFQRIKQENEHLMDSELTEETGKQLYKNDAELDLFQTAIYWWICDFRKQVTDFIAIQKFQLEAVKRNQDAFKSQEPDFIGELKRYRPHLAPQLEKETSTTLSLLDLAKIAISEYIQNISPMSPSLPSSASSSGFFTNISSQQRAINYLTLFASAQGDTEEQLVLYALLNNSAESQLHQAILREIGCASLVLAKSNLVINILAGCKKGNQERLMESINSVVLSLNRQLDKPDVDMSLCLALLKNPVLFNSASQAVKMNA